MLYGCFSSAVRFQIDGPRQGHKLGSVWNKRIIFDRKSRSLAILAAPTRRYDRLIAIRHTTPMAEEAASAHFLVR